MGEDDPCMQALATALQHACGEGMLDGNSLAACRGTCSFMRRVIDESVCEQLWRLYRARLAEQSREVRAVIAGLWGRRSGVIETSTEKAQRQVDSMPHTLRNVRGLARMVHTLREAVGGLSRGDTVLECDGLDRVDLGLRRRTEELASMVSLNGYVSSVAGDVDVLTAETEMATMWDAAFGRRTDVVTWQRVRQQMFPDVNPWGRVSDAMEAFLAYPDREHVSRYSVILLAALYGMRHVLLRNFVSVNDVGFLGMASSSTAELALRRLHAGGNPVPWNQMTTCGGQRGRWEHREVGVRGEGADPMLLRYSRECAASFTLSRLNHRTGEVLHHRNVTPDGRTVDVRDLVRHHQARGGVMANVRVSLVLLRAESTLYRMPYGDDYDAEDEDGDRSGGF